MRIIRLAVQRKRIDVRIVQEKSRRAVALMHIAIDHQRLLNCCFAPEHGDRHRHVVEDAKAGAVPGESMVTAAGDVAGKALIQGQVCGQERAADGGAPAPYQGL